jgi:hypothetical protein
MKNVRIGPFPSRLVIRLPDSLARSRFPRRRFFGCSSYWFDSVSSAFATDAPEIHGLLSSPRPPSLRALAQAHESSSMPGHGEDRAHRMEMHRVLLAPSWPRIALRILRFQKLHEAGLGKPGSPQSFQRRFGHESPPPVPCVWMGAEKDQSDAGRNLRGLQIIAEKAMRGMSMRQVQHFLMVCSLVSDLCFPGYNPKQALAKNSNLACQATRHKIDTSKFLAEACGSRTHHSILEGPNRRL